MRSFSRLDLQLKEETQECLLKYLIFGWQTSFHIWRQKFWLFRGRTIYSNGFFQSILADGYIQHREFGLVSLKSTSSVECWNKNFLVLFLFTGSYRSLNFANSRRNSSVFIRSIVPNSGQLCQNLLKLFPKMWLILILGIEKACRLVLS